MYNNIEETYKDIFKKCHNLNSLQRFYKCLRALRAHVRACMRACTRSFCVLRMCFTARAYLNVNSNDEGPLNRGKNGTEICEVTESKVRGKRGNVPLTGSQNGAGWAIWRILYNVPCRNAPYWSDGISCTLVAFIPERGRPSVWLPLPTLLLAMFSFLFSYTTMSMCHCYNASNRRGAGICSTCDRGVKIFYPLANYAFEFFLCFKVV